MGHNSILPPIHLEKYLQEKCDIDLKSQIVSFINQTLKIFTDRNPITHGVH